CVRHPRDYYAMDYW
nr:immunoglobulin heavy chain junction region [Mus musculus]